MFSLLLAIIYLAFISLGLPDSLLGSSWPVIHQQFGAPLSFAGVITMVVSGGTIISSLMSDRLTKKLGTGLVTAISVGMTAVALFGFSISNSVAALCLWAIPYGLGAGAVDAALNNYVALNYASRHMSWLHCFWGVGAAISPYIMSFALSSSKGWKMGYSWVSIIQFVLAFLIFVSLPLWRKNGAVKNSAEEEPQSVGLLNALKIKGVKLVLLTFLGYCALEGAAGLWASSYLVEYRGINAETAARFASFFYLGITFGRFISGFIADKVGDKRLIRYGIVIVATGIVLIALPLKQNFPALAGLIIIGLGCAPIYPAIIHSTPYNFGKDKSQSIIGIQMASAYVGSTLSPPIFGFIAGNLSVGLYPFYLAVFVILMLLSSEYMNKVFSDKEKEKEKDVVPY